MGLDIILYRYEGKDEQGYLEASPVKHPDWDDNRVSIRHEISDNIPMKELSSGIYGDWDAYYRPADFDKGYEWAKTLNEYDKQYVTNMLDILKSDDNFYLHYSH